MPSTTFCVVTKPKGHIALTPKDSALTVKTKASTANLQQSITLTLHFKQIICKTIDDKMLINTNLTVIGQSIF